MDFPHHQDLLLNIILQDFVFVQHCQPLGMLTTFTEVLSGQRRDLRRFGLVLKLNEGKPVRKKKLVEQLKGSYCESSNSLRSLMDFNPEFQGQMLAYNTQIIANIDNNFTCFRKSLQKLLSVSTQRLILPQPWTYFSSSASGSVLKLYAH